MIDILTAKPGDKYASIKWPALYEKLRSRGYSKEAAARISNAQARNHKKTAYPDQRQFAGYTMEDWDDTKPDSFYHAVKDATFDDLERVVLKGYSQAIVDAVASLVPVLPHFKGEQIAPGITRIRGNLCNVHGRYGRCPGAAVAPTKPPTPKPGQRGRKPVKTPEQRAAELQAKKLEREQERETARLEQDAAKRAQRDKLLTDAGLDNQTRDALVDARAGDVLAPINGEKLAKMGLAERAEDGSYRLTASGRGAVNAALRGDAGALRDTLSKAGEAGKPKPEKPPKSGGGGGGSAKPAKPTPDDKRQAQTQERTQRASETAAAVGLSAGSVANLRAAAEGGTLNDDGTSHGLERLGLIANGEATDQGRRALTALERGDVRQYRAAVQDAQARMGREQAAAGRRAETEQRRTEAERTRQQRQAETERRRTEADQRRAARDEEKRTEPDRKRAARRARREAARNETRMQKSFQVYKQTNGTYRWVAFSSNAYRDRDKEIVSTKALADDCARADQDGAYGPLRWWHVPHVELGTCDFNAMHGRILVESGTFKDARIGARIAAKADQLQLSIGFVHPPNEPDAHGVFHTIRRFERSLVPRGRAANPWTTLAVTKESRMFDNIKRAALKTLGFTDEEIGALSTQAQATQKDADESGATFKEAEAAPAPPDEVTIGGVVYALKAPPLPLPAEEEASAAEVELQADGMEPMMEEESAGGLTLSPEDLTAITEVFTTAIQSALAPVVGMLDIEKKVAGHVQSMLAPYQATKDAADAERQQQVATLTATVEAQQTALKAAQAQLAELLGEQPAALKAGYRATADFQTIVGAARQKELVPPAAESNTDPIVAQLMSNGVNIPGN